MLREFEWVEVTGEAADGVSAVKAIESLRPEVVFLDVQMPGLFGTDVLRRIDRKPYVIFTTAYSEHAVTAFELGAVDYLLKPFGPTRLASAMDRVRSALSEPSSDSIDRLTGALGGGPISRLFVRAGGTLVPVAVDKVLRFEADGDYVVAYPLTGGRHMLHLSLSRLEERLEATRFVRVHRTHIVNLDHVRAFKRDASGNLEAELTDGSRVPVSRAKAQEIRSLGR